MSGDITSQKEWEESSPEGNLKGQYPQPQSALKVTAQQPHPITPSFSAWISHFNIRKEPLTTWVLRGGAVVSRCGTAGKKRSQIIPPPCLETPQMPLLWRSVGAQYPAQSDATWRPTVQELTTPAPPFGAPRCSNVRFWGPAIFQWLVQISFLH